VNGTVQIINKKIYLRKNKLSLYCTPLPQKEFFKPDNNTTEVSTMFGSITEGKGLFR